jgi:hypothetical protein
VDFLIFIAFLYSQTITFKVQTIKLPPACLSPISNQGNQSNYSSTKKEEANRYLHEYTIKKQLYFNHALSPFAPSPLGCH